MRRLVMVSLVLLAVAGAVGAQAQCTISGVIEATPNPNPAGPAWVYSLTAVWDTGTQFALSHFDLLLDEHNGSCTCAEFLSTLSFDDPIGHSDGDPAPCTVPYQGSIECNGDPSIHGEDGIILKFEPVEGTCEPGVSGTATAVFYSDLPPAPITEPCICMVDKSGLNSCTGPVTGFFPSMACDPVPGDESGWSSIKALFR